MSDPKLATPELAAIQVHGVTRASFLVRSALAAGAVYGGGAVAPFVGRALAQTGGGDLDILNFALTLEHLEAAFYEQGLEQVKNLSADAKEIVETAARDEQEHVDTLSQTIQQLGGKPAEPPAVDFGNAFASEQSFLKLAQTLEDTGVAAYNGAAPEIESKEVLSAAGSIVQVEARHAAAVRMLREQPPAPQAFDDNLSRDEVLQRIDPFVKQ